MTNGLISRIAVTPRGAGRSHDLTFEGPVDGTNTTVSAYPGVNYEHRTSGVVPPEPLRHALREERGNDSIWVKGVVGGQHILLASGDMKLHLIVAHRGEPYNTC